MKKLFAIAFAVGFVVCASFGRSQAGESPAATTASPESKAPVIPPDQQPTRQQLAKLFEVMRIREQFASGMQMVPAMIQQQVRQQEKEMTASLPESAKLTPERQAELDKITDRYLEKAIHLYSVDEMLDDMAGIYQKHFTREDVDAYIAFYSTPAGQHMLQITPIIMQEYSPIVMQRVQERTKALTAEMSKEIRDVLQSGASPATAPPAPAP